MGYLHHSASPPFHLGAQEDAGSHFLAKYSLVRQQRARRRIRRAGAKAKNGTAGTVAQSTSGAPRLPPALLASVVYGQPESISEALDVVAFGAAYKSVSALTNKSECFLIMLVIHSLWSPSMMTAFAKLLINSKDISATGALKLLGCIIKADWSSMANSEIKLFCPHYWRSCPGPMHLSEVKDGLEKNWEKFEALAVSASSLPYSTCRIGGRATTIFVG